MTLANSRPEPDGRPPTRARRALAALLGVCGLAVSLGAAGDTSVPARLTAISTLAEGRATTVVIEASEPVSYVTAMPDPLTVVVDLRNVSAAGVTHAVGRPVGPVADVAVADTRGVDGVTLVRVRLALAAPVMPTVRSRRNAILVEFSGALPVGSAMPAAAPVAPAAATRQGDGISLKKADIVYTPMGTRVTIAGTGALPAASAEETREGPLRLVLDLKGVTAAAQTVAGPAQGPVERVRVAQNSREPLIARVVIDMRQRAAYRVEQAGGQVAVVFEPAGAPAPVPLPAAAPGAAPKPVVTGSAGPEPVVVRTTPEPVKPAVEAPKPEPVKPAAEAPKPEPAKPPVEAPKPEPAKPPVEAPKPEPAKPAAQANPDVEKASANQVPTQPEKAYTGRPVTFDFAGADLRAVLRTFSEPEISGLNVVIDPAIQGTVDVSLRDVPWDQALEIILRANKLGYVIENNVVRIAPLKALAEEETERRKLAEEQAKSGQLRVLTRTLSYAKATNIAKLLKDARVITDRGTAFVDERSNTLIVNDLPDALAACDDLINTLDRAEPQVEIEARIVQTTRDSARALGVQWGVNGRMASELGNTSPLRFPATGSVSGRTGNTQNSPVGAVREISPTGVNLPVTGATTAVGLAMGTLNGSFNLDVALSAIEKNGHGKILSTPRVMMQNNVEAEMMQGIQIPIQTVSNNTVTVTFKDAALQLRVKPQITAANTVILDLNLENASPDYSREVNGIPPIDTQRAKTQVLVQDSETMVIGGIFVTRETGSTDKVPYLHRIPLFGWLFKRDINSGEDRELLIFITPRIRR